MYSPCKALLKRGKCCNTQNNSPVGHFKTRTQLPFTREKKTKTLHRSFLAALTMMVVFSVNAFAQQNTSFSLNQFGVVSVDEPVASDNDEDFPLVSEYKNMPLMDWDMNWWDSLEREISLENESYRSLSGAQLQNAIFFLANHGERVDLTSSASTLLDVYLYNKHEAKRIMALAALIHIGDKESLETAEYMLYRQQSERVKDFSIAALTAYKANYTGTQLMMADK